MLLTLALALGTSGCRTFRSDVMDLAHRGGLEAEVLIGTEFQHQSFHAKRDSVSTLLVFLDGDGTPWTHGGTLVAADPTPRVPLALDLATLTKDAVLYLGRPCYFGSARTSNCSPELWTSARYSRRVVDSTAAALNRFIDQRGYQHAILIGFSGGGTLGVLMAPHVPALRAVVTIAANLDTDAWTAFHHYLPLDASLNPVQEPSLPSAIREWHIVGARDRNVPAELNKRYWNHVPAEHIWEYADADHACCWVEKWPAILARLQAELARDTAAANH